MTLTSDDIYTYVKDQAVENDLLEGLLQSSPELITLAMKLAVDDFNNEQPLTSYTILNCPSDVALLYGTLHHIANSEAERQLRNQVTYSAQGLNANLDDKYPQYNQLASYYRQLFESKTSKIKQAINIASAWGGMSSPYNGINSSNTED